MLVLFAITAIVSFQVGFILFCFRLKQHQDAGQPLQFASLI